MTAQRNTTEFVVEGLGEMDFDGTLFGGQSFRWRRTGDNAADGWIGDRPVAVTLRSEGLAVRARNSDVKGLESAARAYFDADRDYPAIRARLSRDPRLARHITGLRILRQPPFETVITFIASANNNIIRIGRTVAALSRMAGDEVPVGGTVEHTFPTPARLATLTIEELRGEANLGYRDRYVLEAAQLVASGDVTLDHPDDTPSDELRARLSRLPGVGPKVADCIALFAYGRFDVFPVDTWIRKIYSDMYLGADAIATDRAIGELARKRYGRYAGLAQQYLFEAARRGDRASSADQV